MTSILPPERAGRTAPEDLASRRAGLAAALAAGMWRTDPAPEVVTLGGVRTLRFAPPGPPRATLLHFHGGAFRIGCPEQIAPFASAVAARCGVTVLCPAYRLAPEHPFPAGLRDAQAAFGALQTEGQIILSGDSAGGGLAAGLTALTQFGEAPPAGLILLSPWLDLRVDAASFAANAATDPLFSTGSASQAAELYLQGHSANDPLASPLLADVAAFPPSFISVGAGEVLLDDATALAARFRHAGIACTLDVVPGMEHVAVARDLTLPGAAQTFAAVTSFIESVLVSTG